MKEVELLNSFFERIKTDPRIALSHISIYCALLKMSFTQGGNEVYCRNRELMEASKISGRTVFHRRMRELDEYGYVKYIVCFNHRKKNRIVLFTVT